ncbi:mandelate racemase/muconate lactonizing enzyme family protein [Occultella gossypii]|uniref:Mandelate racemase/muconate lactonizing enzyme family protein n=1 Tax=Occultella gossypii TaxID=2800820 RepID=A0ABS7S3F0_9MICO|nr:mandelate racemase/muconate lactonizing enzyme family protein [Occultella gossypii]MBZ2194853.1 mandelate racemase/muconate lactonizing enzyme family protein [Occultella gossypii]
MKITSIETLSVGSRMPGNGKLTDRNFMFVLVHTDEGLTGLGEATLEGHDNAVRGMITDLEGLLLGEDPRRIEYLTQVMMRQKFWQGGVIKGSAVAGVELALWDILGKVLDAPVYSLVGGASRDRIRYYVNGWTQGSLDPVEIGERAGAAVEQGHRALKLSLALPSWPVRDRELIDHIATVAGAIRDTVGPEVLLMLDGHGRYDVDQAIAIAGVLADHDFFFLEEPVQPTRVSDTVRVARAANLPIAAGERLARKEEFAEYLRADAISVVQPDVAHCHGFGEALKIASLADTFGAWIAPHGPMSPVMTTISLHLDAVAPNFLIQERVLAGRWSESVITTPLVMEDGYLPLPTGPGWGIELDEDVCRSHPPFPVTIPRLFRGDGSVADW